MFFLLPLGTTRPHWRMPWVTYGLIAINTLVMAYALWVPEVRLPAFIPARPDLGTWLASMFVHGSVAHLLSNMLFLWLFGTVAEDTLGPLLFLAFYFAGSAGATVLDWGVSSTFLPGALAIPHLGASGAIAGIMGLSAVCFMRTRVRLGYLYGWLLYWRAGVIDVRAPVFLGIWVALQVVEGAFDTAHTVQSHLVSGGVAYWAHVGGFALGALGALALRLRKKISREDLLTGRAKLEDTSGLFSQAGELQKVLQETPHDAEAWYALGKAQEKQGRTTPAAESYRKALSGFIKQREPVRAAAAYVALSLFQRPESVPVEIMFDVACALDEAARLEEAYDLFMLAAKHHPHSRTGETALVRAGEIARRFLKDKHKAGDAFWWLLHDYPHSDWRRRALEGLRALDLPETAPWTAPPNGDDDGPAMERLR